MDALRSCFVRVQTWLQAGKYVNALARAPPSRNGWSIAEQAGDCAPDRMQPLLNAAWLDRALRLELLRRAGMPPAEVVIGGQTKLPRASETPTAPRETTPTHITLCKDGH